MDPIAVICSVLTSISGGAFLEIIKLSYENKKSAKEKTEREKKERLLKELDDIKNIDDIIRSAYFEQLREEIKNNPHNKDIFIDFLKSSKLKNIIQEYIKSCDMENKIKLLNIIKNELKKYYINAFSPILSLIEGITKKILSDGATASFIIFKNIEEIQGILIGLEEQIEVGFSRNNTELKELRNASFQIQDRLSEKEYGGKFKTIEQNLHIGCIITARIQAKQLLNDIMNSGNNYEKYLINKYIADTYLKTNTEKGNAIIYLKECVKYSEDLIIKNKIQSIIFLLEDNYYNGLQSIDLALKSKPDDINFLLIKAYILVALNKLPEATDLFSSINDENNYEILNYKAWIAFINSNYKSAICLAYKAIKLNSNNKTAYHTIIDSYLTLFQNSLQLKGFSTAKETIKMRKAIRIIGNYLKIISEEEKDTLSIVYAQKGLINLWMFKYSEAYDDFKKAYGLHNGYSETIKNLILTAKILNRKKELEEFLNILRKSVASDIELEIFIMEYLLEIDPKAVIKSIESSLTNKDLNNNSIIKLNIILINAHFQCNHTIAALSLLDEILKTYPSNEELILLKTDLLLKMGKSEEVINIINDYYLSTKSSNYNFDYSLALAYEIRGNTDNHKIASGIFEKYASIELLSPILFKFIKSLFLSKQYVKCINICSKVRKLHGFIEEIYGTEGEIYLNSSNYRAALDIFIELSEKGKPYYKYYLALSICYYYLGYEDKALDSIRKAESISGITSNEYYFISNAYINVGRNIEGLKFAYKAVKYNVGNPYIDLWFINLMAQTQLEREHLSPDMKEAYISKYKELLQSFEQKYPNSNLLISKKIEDPQKSAEDIIQLLKDKSVRTEQYEVFYKTHYFPIGFLSSAGGEDFITAWQHVVHSKHLYVHTTWGKVESLEEEIKSASLAKEIILDPIALLTIQEIGIFDVLLNRYKHIYVDQSVMDNIINQITLSQISENREKHSIGIIEGKPTLISISKDFQEKWINYLNELKTILKSDGINILGSAQYNYTSEVMKKDEFVIGHETMLTLIQANDRNLTLYSEDWLVREYYKLKFSKPSFGIIALIESLRQDNLITPEGYQDILIELILLRYFCIPINADTLIFALEKHGYHQNNPEAFLLFEYLRKPEHNIQSLISMTIYFLKKIWLDGIPLEYRKYWTEAILDSITFNRLKRRKEIIQKIMTTKLSSLHFALEKEYHKVLAAWSSKVII